ncbi:MAG TPA: sigma-70 family RNA polymerase sigma factor [Candidatus Limnocylindria bacterium]|nr:sigma-70 family RNA polymerase sigma factor [Candidatus Limnocylindria bacterium]
MTRPRSEKPPAPLAGASTAASARAEGGAASDPDVVLMLRVQAGDLEAFPLLFERYAPRVLQFVRRFVAHEARAEELTQDVFAQIFRFRRRYRPESRLSTWVFRIATNLCLNELRRPEQRLRVDLWKQQDSEEDREGPMLADPDAPTPEAAAAARELAAALDREIAALPGKQRAALLLSRMDGLAYRDVAEVLGCSEGAVKALLFRAIHGLRGRLRDHLEEK